MNGLDRAALLNGLQRLGLTHMHQVAEHRAEEAAAASAGYLEFLHRLVEEELAVRFERYVETRTRLASFPFRKTLEQFDFDAQPGVDKRAITELTSMAFVERATNVVLLGPPGCRRPLYNRHKWPRKVVTFGQDVKGKRPTPCSSNGGSPILPQLKE